MSWEGDLSAFQKKTFTCPSCNTKQSAEPISVSGTGINESKTTADRARVVFTSSITFQLFLPYETEYSPGYAICQCKSCRKRVVVEFSSYHRDPTVVWPMPGTSVSEDIPEPIRLAVIDAKRAHAADSKTGAIMSLRTAVERLQRDKKVSSLSELWKKESLPPGYFDTVNEPRLWGHLIAHADFDYLGVKSEHVEELITFTDIILDIVYEMPARLARSHADRQRIEQTETQESPSSGDPDAENQEPQQHPGRPPFIPY